MRRLLLAAFSVGLLAGGAAPTHASGGQSDLWSVRSDGSHLRQLTNDSERDFQPSVSPDGTLIAWARGTPSQIWVMRRDGTDQTKLTAMPEDAFAPQWSPDGHRLAFMVWNSTQCHPGEKWCAFTDVWVVNADGSNQRRFAPGINPRWSADSRRLVFCEFDPNIQSTGLELAVVGTGAVRTLVTAAFDQPMASPPAWAPRGGWIAFAYGPGVHSSLGTIRATGARRHRLGRGLNPAWSPNGRGLAVVRPGGVWLLSPLGQPLRRLVRFSSRGSMPLVWSPEGKRIAYERGDRLVVVRVSGGRPRAVASGLRQYAYDLGHSPPTWSRDGRTLIFAR